MPVIIPTATDKPTLAMVENSTPVDLRLLRKAMNPPVTIEKFFKPRSKLSDKRTLIEITLDSSNSNSHSDYVTNVTRCATQETTTHFYQHELRGTPSCTNSNFDKEMPSERKSGDADNFPTNVGRHETTLKRVAEDNLPRKDPIKRSKKQGSILLSFQNSCRSQETRQCPICKSPLSPSLSNQEINDHMDVCLIE